MPDVRLTTSRYVRPGTYIGFVPTPSPIAAVGTPRYPCYVGRGSRLARTANSRHTRSRVYAEQLSFSAVPPYRADLDHDAVNDQSLAQLYKQSGDPVANDRWMFRESVSSGGYDQIEIDQTFFDANATYLIEYQSVDRAVQDELLFDDLREMLFVGDGSGLARYVEGTDYRIVTSLTGQASDTDALQPGTSNTNLTGGVSAVTYTNVPPNPPGAATVAFNASNAYALDYNREYTLTVATIGGASPNFTVTFDLEVAAESGGNSQDPNVPFHAAFASPRTVTIQEGVNDTAFALSTTSNWAPGTPLPSYYSSDGIVLDFTHGVGNFQVGDTYSWKAYGPGLVELSSAHDNTNQYAIVQTPVEGSTNTSGGSLAVSSLAEYSDDFDRDYFLKVTASGGAYPARTATVRWAGYDEIPFTEGTLSLIEGTPASFQNVQLERGVYLTFSFGTAHAAADGVNTLVAADANTLSTALTLANAFKAAHNAHDADAVPTWHAIAGGSHQIAAANATDLPTLRTLCLEIQSDYAAHLADATMHNVADTKWVAAYTVTATSSLADIVLFLNNIKSQYNRHRQAVGIDLSDEWTVSAKTARVSYSAKDDRAYALTVNSVSPGTSVTFTWNAMTYEGGWGSATMATYGDPWSDLPDDIRLMWRNLESTERIAANDTFSFAATNDDLVDWSLSNRVTETIAASEIRLDVAGTVTGTPLTYYVTLEYTPTSILRVVQSASPTTPVSYSAVANTPYLTFSSDPGVAIEVAYEHRGVEPDPGASYYITANRLRASTEYNTPIRYLDRDASDEGTAPHSSDNHLWLMTDLAFDTEFFGCYVVQVASAAANETFTVADYRTAIDATETNSDISDLVVLNHYASLAYSKDSVEQMNAPFQAKERLLWVGAPVGTTIGDTLTADTLVYLARVTLQVAPSSPARGNIILMSNVEATRTYILEDGSSTLVTLDGSYIAGYAAARTASFTDPTDTLYKKDTGSFDSMETYNEREEELLGDASMTFMHEVGTGQYRFGESITVDKSQPALQEISVRVQAHYGVRRIRNDLNEFVNGLVPPSPAAGVIMIQNQLVQSLAKMVSDGIFAPYGSDEDPPTIRQISPGSDVRVKVDASDRRQYYFDYYFVAKYPIKRLFGLYSIDSRFWDARDAAA